MKTIVSLPLAFVLFLTLCFSASGATVAEELERVSNKVATLNLGFGDYILGKKLTADQKETAKKNPEKKALKGTYKFKDGEIYVIAANEGDTVLGVYKDYPDTTMETLKPVIGSLMFQHGEPTAMAHNKLIYWTYDENGKIDQDVFDFERENGGTKSLVAIKFSSTEPIVEEKAQEGEETEQKDSKELSAYVMITSDPLSKLFLVLNKEEEK